MPALLHTVSSCVYNFSRVPEFENRFFFLEKKQNTHIFFCFSREQCRHRVCVFSIIPPWIFVLFVLKWPTSSATSDIENQAQFVLKKWIGENINRPHSCESFQSTDQEVKKKKKPKIVAKELWHGERNIRNWPVKRDDAHWLYLCVTTLAFRRLMAVNYFTSRASFCMCTCTWLNGTDFQATSKKKRDLRVCD